MNHSVSIIGLGGMGRSMVQRMSEHPGFTPVTAWDEHPGSRTTAAEQFPDLEIGASLQDAIATDRTPVIYVATPPNTHAEICRMGLNAGKAVYCEKPLGVDIATSESLVAQANASGLPNLVNFSLASTAATRAAEAWLSDLGTNRLVRIELAVRFSQWPRAWQTGASGWLAGPAQGGFVREVVSHFVYLAERLVGGVECEESSVTYAENGGSETFVHAQLTAAGVPMTITGSIGGVGPDVIDFTLWGSEASARIARWHRFEVSDGSDWVVDQSTTADAGRINNAMQLANAAAAVSGNDHSMPDFKAGLSVQRTIEQILAHGSH